MDSRIQYAPLQVNLTAISESDSQTSSLPAILSLRIHRTSNSDLFPFVDIWKDGDQYMSFGYELFSYNNDVTEQDLKLH